MASVKKARSLVVLRWLLLLPLPLVWCLLAHYGLLNFLEEKSVDWRFQYRGELPSPVKIVYVDVDSLSLDRIGNLPWSRDLYATVASALVNEAKVRAIGFDFVFSDSGVPESVDLKRLVYGNKQFGRFLEKSPPVVLAASYNGWKFRDINYDQNHKTWERQLPLIASDPRKLSAMEPPEIPVFQTSPDGNKRTLQTPPVAVGLIDTLENGVRKVPAWAPNNLKIPYFHMAVQLARIYWGLPRDGLRIRDNHLEFLRKDGTVFTSLPLIDGQLLEINWFTKWYSDYTAHAEFADVLMYAQALESTDPADRAEGKAYFANPDFKDAVILIGPVDRLLQDVAPTSLDEEAVPKVGLHGNLLKTIVSGLLIERFTPRTNWLIVFGLTIIVATLSVAGGARAVVAKFVAVLAIAGYVMATFHVFEQSHLLLPFTAPIGAAITTSFASLLWQVIDEQKAKGRIKGMFGAYVSPQLVERMIESGDDPKLGGHDAEITAYFSDIQGFSGFSEILGSGPLVELMNEYLTACTDIVQAQGGTLDKYIGDAVVAMFGAPIPLSDHAFRACVATQLVHQKLSELRTKWKAEGDKWPEIVWRMQSRIGLNTGECMIGNMGSRTRFNYTMMGDNVNLAARMESGAKTWGAYTMCTETTKQACEQHGGDRVVFRAINRIVVMGRSHPVPIFEIVGLKETVTPATHECIGLFEQGLAKYYQRDWDGAIALFNQSALLEPNQPGVTPGVKSNPSLACLAIAQKFKIHPPEPGWDGSYRMTEK